MVHSILIIRWWCSKMEQGIWGHYDPSPMVIICYSITLHLSHMDPHCPMFLPPLCNCLLKLFP